MKMYFEYNPRGFANECSVYYALPSHKGTVKKVEELISSSQCAALRRISAKDAYKYERRHHHRDYPLPCVTQLLREIKMEKIVYCTHVDKSEHFTEVSRLYAYSLPSGMEAKPNEVLVVENLSSLALVQCVCVIEENRSAKSVIKNLGVQPRYSALEDQILEASRMITSGEKTPEDFIGSYLDEIAWSNMKDPLPRPRRARSIRAYETKNMKLFRRHTAAFQRQIESSDSFVQDTSRKYNRDGEKNAACFYFYACTEDGAGNYRQYNAYGDEIDTELHTYEADAKLLDLRREEDRAKCTALIDYLHAEQIENAKKMLRSYDSELKSAENIKKARERRATIEMLNRFMREAESFIANYSIEDVIADKRRGGLSLWGQTASDYGAGVALKSDLQRLGYDGVIYEDFDSVEVALIVPACEFIGLF